MKRAFLPGLLLIVNLAAAPAALPAEGMAKAGDWPQWRGPDRDDRSEEHTSELQSLRHLVCRLLLEKKKHNNEDQTMRHIQLVRNLAKTDIVYNKLYVTNKLRTKDLHHAGPKFLERTTTQDLSGTPI